MKRWRVLPAIVLGAFTLASLPADGYQILHHHFPYEGDDPQSTLVRDSGGNVYGTTTLGGIDDNGTVFRMASDGSGFTILHVFAGAADGRNPSEGLVLDGVGYLYGVTRAGGASGVGTVYKVKTDGTGFTVLHVFTGSPTDGDSPFGRLCYDGSGTLYGTTMTGGANNAGTVFQISTGGGSFGLVHSFAVSEGCWPKAGVVLDGSGRLYGTSSSGGIYNAGTVWTVKIDGSWFGTLHEFAGAPDGSDPEGALVLDGSGNFYGTTFSGGVSDKGTVFKLSTTTYSILHSFVSDTDGEFPKCTLALDASGKLYGTTENGGGGAFNVGTVFSLQTSGMGFTVLHRFVNPDPFLPYAGVTLDAAGNLYGTTSGGVSCDGSVFVLKNDGTGFSTLHTFRGSDGTQPLSRLTAGGGGVFYGTTSSGGRHDHGAIFSVKSDGTGYRILYSFTGGQYGSAPNPSLVLSSGVLYGTTRSDGLYGFGAVFRVGTNGANFDVLHYFGGTPGDGRTPEAGLIGSDPLWGTTSAGGASNLGTIFKVSADGTVYSVLHSFAGGASDGSGPFSLLLSDLAGDLYGTTYFGGSTNNGTIYKVHNDGMGFLVLHSFAGGAADGKQPYAGLFPDPSWTLYGTTYRGGTSNVGTVYKIGATGAGYAVIHHFIGGSSDGYSPYGGVVADGSGYLYGTTVLGGPSNGGTVYRLSTGGGSFALLHAFTGGPADGAWPQADLAGDASGNLYGTTQLGGASSVGTIFTVPISCASGDTTAPVVTPPSAITVDQTACCGTSGGATGAGSAALASFLSGGSALDDCSVPTRLAAQIGGVDVTNSTCLEPGATSVTFRFQDASSHIGSAASTVTVRMFGDLNLDSTVDPSDMVIMRSYFNFAVTPGTPPFAAPLEIADLTHDAAVDPSDLVVLRSYFNFAVTCLAP